MTRHGIKRPSKLFSGRSELDSIYTIQVGQGPHNCLNFWVDWCIKGRYSLWNGDFSQTYPIWDFYRTRGIRVSSFLMWNQILDYCFSFQNNHHILTPCLQSVSQKSCDSCHFVKVGNQFHPAHSQPLWGKTLSNCISMESSKSQLANAMNCYYVTPTKRELFDLSWVWIYLPMSQ